MYGACVTGAVWNGILCEIFCFNFMEGEGRIEMGKFFTRGGGVCVCVTVCEGGGGGIGGLVCDHDLQGRLHVSRP